MRLGNRPAIHKSRTVHQTLSAAPQPAAPFPRDSQPSSLKPHWNPGSHEVLGTQPVAPLSHWPVVGLQSEGNWHVPHTTVISVQGRAGCGRRSGGVGGGGVEGVGGRGRDGGRSCPGQALAAGQPAAAELARGRCKGKGGWRGSHAGAAGGLRAAGLTVGQDDLPTLATLAGVGHAGASFNVGLRRRAVGGGAGW